MPLVAPLFPYRRPMVPDRATTADLTAERTSRPAHTPRDVTIDVLRGSCLAVVLLLHSLMVGVTRGTDGGLVTSVALSGTWGFTLASWFFQVMPLFFMAGGFASLSQWRRFRAAGRSGADYVVGRVRRLGLPTAVMITCVGAALLTARICGASPELIRAAGLHAVQPLWFLAVYLGCTALVPVMARLHARHRVATLAWLGTGVLLIDLGARSWGPGLGYLNLGLLWLLMQQLGFLVLDGVGPTFSRPRLFGAAAACVLAFAGLVACGWSPDLLVNLNPPTAALMVAGLAQFFLLVALKPRLDAWLSAPRTARRAARLNACSMGLYLWHLPVALGIVAVLGGIGAGLPQPMSGAWWATRLPWLVSVVGASLLAVAGASRLEAGVRSLLGSWPGRPDLVPHTPTTALAVAVCAVVAGIGGTTTVLLTGASSWVGVPVAVGMMWSAVVLARPRTTAS